MNTTNHHIFKGVALSLLGYLFMALMSACAKGLGEFPMPTLIFFQSILSLILTIPHLLRGEAKGIKTKHPFLILIRCAAGFMSILMMFYAINHIPLVTAVLLQNTTPLFVPIVMLVGLGQFIPYKLWSGLLLGFIGVILILQPHINTLNIAVLIGLSAGIFSAISFVTVSLLKSTEPTNRILFYYFFLSILVTTPFVITHWKSINLQQGLLFVGLGCFMYFGQMLVTHAYQYSKASTLAPLTYSGVVFAGLLNWILWHHTPDLLSFVGIVLVIFGGIITIVLENTNSLKLSRKRSLNISL